MQTLMTMHLLVIQFEYIICFGYPSKYDKLRNGAATLILASFLILCNRDLLDWLEVTFSFLSSFGLSFVLKQGFTIEQINEEFYAFYVLINWKFIQLIIHYLISLHIRTCIFPDKYLWFSPTFGKDIKKSNLQKVGYRTWTSLIGKLPQNAFSPMAHCEAGRELLYLRLQQAWTHQRQRRP